MIIQKTTKKNHDDNDEYGAILEVDIEYPKELSYKHKDLPFLPERRKVKSRKTCYNLRKQRKIHNTHINIKTSIRSRIKI